MEGIEVDVTANLVLELNDKEKEIKRLKQLNKQLNKEIKLLKNVITRYQEALDANMNSDKNIEYRGKNGLEIDYMEIDEKA